MEYDYKVLQGNGHRFHKGELDKFVCKDGYIHIRLRKYGHRKERIVGFYEKLRFIVTMFVQQNVDKRMLGASLGKKDDNDNAEKLKRLWLLLDAIEDTRKSDVLKKISYLLEALMWQPDKFKGVSISTRCCKEKDEDLRHATIGGLLGTSRFKFDSYDYTDADVWSIVEFLADDGQQIVIEPKTEVDYSMFENRKKTVQSIWY